MEAFPLHWPIGYKRSPQRIFSRFKVTMDKSQRFLREEIKRLGGTDLIVSTNIPIRKDGGMYADWMNKKIDDPGVAIYFKYKGKDISMCCDQYTKIWENVYALGKGIEALRGMERWGVSDFIDRAFTGFAALPDPDNKEESCYEILGVMPWATEEEINKAYKDLCKIRHPDKGGSTDAFTQLLNAQCEALSRLKT